MNVTLIETVDGSPLFDSSTLGTPGVSSGPKAAVDAVTNLLNALNSYSLSSRVQSEFSNLTPALDSTISSWANDNPTGKCYPTSTVGCVVQLAIYKESAPIGQSDVYQFIGLYEGSPGLDFQSALNDMRSLGSLSEMAPDGSMPTSMYFFYQQDQ